MLWILFPVAIVFVIYFKYFFPSNPERLKWRDDFNDWMTDKEYDKITNKR